jgi:crotonobetainyl-CoA:carnitine CoA-transferase CaiB-like acyl-CoA transferase
MLDRRFEVALPVADPMLLSGVRVIDMTDDRLEMTARLLADIGADVIRAEPSGGSPSRRRPPFDDGGNSIFYAVRNANKRGVTIDATAEGTDFLWRLLASADIWIRAERPGGEGGAGPDVDEVRRCLPGLVILTVSDFGRTGPYRSFVASDPVHLALGSQLSRSGLPGRDPLIPPARMAHEPSAAQAAWAVLLAYYHRLQTGVGDHIDYSIYETVLQVVDPPFGTIGTATAAATSGTQIPAHLAAERGRPTRNNYPIFPCADGYVRLVVLSVRQWRAMRAWLGEPAQFQDARFDTVAARHKAQDELHALYREFFRDKAKFELADEGQRRGIPITAVLSPAEVLQQEHYLDRGTFVDAELAPGHPVRLPSGFVEVDGTRAGYRFRAPGVGEHDGNVRAELAESGAEPASAGSASAGLPPALPLRGVRIIDFGIIVFGAEVGRLFADMGAEVIKIENEAFPDTSRHAVNADLGVSVTFALGHRNEQGFGVDLRTPEGSDIIKRLVARADVVLSNFKPGTLEKLGLGYEELKEVNPSLVWMSASGFGHTGPWRNWLAYGPLVRSASGLTELWRYPDDESGFADPTTVYPDHYGARVAAAAVLAALIRCRREARGADIRLSQAEVVINHLAEYYAAASISPEAGPSDHGEQWGSPWGIFPCLGDDEWCVITVISDAEWHSMTDAMGHPEWAADARFITAEGRIAHRADLDAALRTWTERLGPAEVMATLQKARVPCGVMRRIPELEDDPHLVSREFMTTLPQPGYTEPLPIANRPFWSLHIARPPQEPAPLRGEHTTRICAEVLGMTAEEIARLVTAGILQTADTRR